MYLYDLRLFNRYYITIFKWLTYHIVFHPRINMGSCNPTYFNEESLRISSYLNKHTSEKLFCHII
jgi:hypothetical protein